MQLALQQILFACKVGLEVLQTLEFALVIALACLVDLLVVDRLLAFEQLQAHVGGAEVATDTDEVGVVCSVAVDNLFVLCFADAGDGYGESCV